MANEATERLMARAGVSPRGKVRIPYKRDWLGRRWIDPMELVKALRTMQDATARIEDAVASDPAVVLDKHAGSATLGILIDMLLGR